MLSLPRRALDLNAVEMIWQFMRDNRISSRVFTEDDDTVVHCRKAGNKLVDQAWKIISSGMRDWSLRF
ncbi:hypothetical protein [Aureimonas pseudogalii]|uniref:Transposase n=1 Tax=Aureimonas pseudogalii TaxID=1744844 RepID=A0A7W6H8V7_9HYPH|nr:hypothetical protein [Aureimonas pseudogalii]MBB4000741.1 hypothetical protein [Aureimonas pseudogalii]